LKECHGISYGLYHTRITILGPVLDGLSTHYLCMPEFYRQPDVSKLELVNLLVETLKPVGKISVH